ncbi:hypothetical protein FQR65_LT04021 [Abscondita terminalis]|nr:hypothetical protein FQR65_LT04021 [Abscondita terminalis]
MEHCEEEYDRMLECDDNAVTAIIKLQRKLGVLQLKQGERRSLEHMKNNDPISVPPDEKMESGCDGSSSSVKYCNENDVNATKRQVTSIKLPMLELRKQSVWTGQAALSISGLAISQICDKDATLVPQLLCLPEVKSKNDVRNLRVLYMMQPYR